MTCFSPESKPHLPLNHMAQKWCWTVTYRVSGGSFLHRYASTAEVPTGFHVPIRLYHSLLVHSLQHHAPCQKNWGHLQRCLCTRKAWTLQAGFWISVQI